MTVISRRRLAWITGTVVRVLIVWHRFQHSTWYISPHRSSAVSASSHSISCYSSSVVSGRSVRGKGGHSSGRIRPPQSLSTTQSQTDSWWKKRRCLPGENISRHLSRRLRRAAGRLFVARPTLDFVSGEKSFFLVRRHLRRRRGGE